MVKNIIFLIFLSPFYECFASIIAVNFFKFETTSSPRHKVDNANIFFPSFLKPRRIQILYPGLLTVLSDGSIPPSRHKKQYHTPVGLCCCDIVEARPSLQNCCKAKTAKRITAVAMLSCILDNSFEFLPDYLGHFT